MAKLFKTSIFLLLAALLLIAEANHHNDNSDDESDGGALRPSLKLKGLVPKFRSGGANGSGGTSGGNGGSDIGSVSGGGVGGGEGCKCNDPKFKEFIKKFSILYRAYISKELAPEMKSVLGKLTDFTMNYLAKEKPDEINKVHNFLQNSAKATGSAVAQIEG